MPSRATFFVVAGLLLPTASGAHGRLATRQARGSRGTTTSGEWRASELRYVLHILMVGMCFATLDHVDWRVAQANALASSAQCSWVVAMQQHRAGYQHGAA
jgi:hypothetical protein